MKSNNLTCNDNWIECIYEDKEKKQQRTSIVSQVGSRECGHGLCPYKMTNVERRVMGPNHVYRDALGGLQFSLVRLYFVSLICPSKNCSSMHWDRSIDPLWTYFLFADIEIS